MSVRVWLLALVLAAAVPSAAGAAAPRKVVLLLTGDVGGEIAPCG
jgi:hypothetical protein